MRTHYIAYDPFNQAWGKGTTESSAMREMNKNGGEDRYSIYHVHQSTHVDDMGQFCRKADCDPIKWVKDVGFKRNRPSVYA